MLDLNETPAVVGAADQSKELQDLRDSNARMSDLFEAIRARLCLDEGEGITDEVGRLRDFYVASIDAISASAA